jgi:hypothetical protein
LPALRQRFVQLQTTMSPFAPLKCVTLDKKSMIWLAIDKDNRFIFR